MTHRQERWIKHAATVEGGSVGAMKAKTMWDEWSAVQEHVRGWEGPLGSILQLYVSVDVELCQDETVTHG